MMGHKLVWTWLAAGAVISLGCHRQQVLTTPESDHIAYASAYPEHLRSLRTRFAKDAEEALESFDGLRSLPGSVPPSDADELEQIVRRADAAGRSQHYVEEALRQEEIDALMHENRSAIRRRVAGSVAFVAKEKECLKEDVDSLAGTAASATDRAVDRQLEERLRARNPAQRYLRAHVDDFGEQRANALERQVDTLSRASFVSNVRLALYQSELEAALDDEKAIATTLERDEAEGRAALEAQTLTKSHRLAIEEQVARDEAARLALPTEVSASKNAEKDLEARAQQLQKDYQALLDQLLAELAKRQQEAAANPASAKPSNAGTKASGSVSGAATTPAPAAASETPAPEGPPPPPESTPEAGSGGAPAAPAAGGGGSKPEPAPAPPKSP
jgi:hypothetical protein